MSLHHGWLTFFFFLRAAVPVPRQRGENCESSEIQSRDPVQDGTAAVFLPPQPRARTSIGALIIHDAAVYDALFA